MCDVWIEPPILETRRCQFHALAGPVNTARDTNFKNKITQLRTQNTTTVYASRYDKVHAHMIYLPSFSSFPQPFWFKWPWCPFQICASNPTGTRPLVCLACLPRARQFSLSPTTSKRLLRRLVTSHWQWWIGHRQTHENNRDSPSLWFITFSIFH